MFEVNRSVIIVRPTHAFYELYKSLPNSRNLTYAELREESHSYLLPRIELKGPPSKIIPDDLAHNIFEWELLMREVYDEYWPKSRQKIDDLLEWFEIQIVPEIFDSSEDELNRFEV